MGKSHGCEQSCYTSHFLNDGLYNEDGTKANRKERNPTTKCTVKLRDRAHTPFPDIDLSFYSVNIFIYHIQHLILDL